MKEQWEDPVQGDAWHNIDWASSEKNGFQDLEEIRKALLTKLEAEKPTLGSILVGKPVVDFQNSYAEATVGFIRRWGDCVVIRPYFYEAFNYFDIGLILSFTAAIALQIVQLNQEMTVLSNTTTAEEMFEPGSFVIAQTHSARMYLIAFGSFFCWCKVR